MQAGRITDEVLKALQAKSHDVIIINYANCDMIGHTGDFTKTTETISYLDACVKAIATEVQAQNGLFFLTSDHGNAELKVDFNTGRTSKDHTVNPVPFLMVKEDMKKPTDTLFKITYGARISGILQDVAPTILTHMGLPIPDDMTGVRVF
jgi:2,3-bisphosphoglycerate-independent phosphoglycerate mutase